MQGAREGGSEVRGVKVRWGGGGSTGNVRERGVE